MPVYDAYALVPFKDVRILRCAPTAVRCRIGDRSVWLPRMHVSTRLLCTGERGDLAIRRWVARDRGLLGPDGFAMLVPPLPPPSPRRLPAQLRLLSRERGEDRVG
jgi:hypothetical protein